MQLAMREWQGLARWRGPLSALAFGGLLGVMGPFGSQSLGPAVKYPFWMALSLAGFGVAAAAERLVATTALSASPARRLAAVAVISAVPMTFFVAWTMGLVQPGRTFTPVQMLALFPYVALVQLLIARVLAASGPRIEGGVAMETAVAPEYPPEFLAKLPPALRRDILALEAEDHYLRVHTRHGAVLILMRLADAAAMIDPRLGLRVHRSWWVAKDGVRGLERTQGRAIVRLVDDVAVPVSRTHLPAARKALGN